MLSRLLISLAFALAALLQPVAAFAMSPCAPMASVAGGCAAPGDCPLDGSKPSQQLCMTVCTAPCAMASATLPADVGAIAPQRTSSAPWGEEAAHHSSDPGRIDRPPKG